MGDGWRVMALQAECSPRVAPGWGTSGSTWAKNQPLICEFLRIGENSKQLTYLKVDSSRGSPCPTSGPEKWKLETLLNLFISRNPFLHIFTGLSHLHMCLCFSYSLLLHNQLQMYFITDAKNLKSSLNLISSISALPPSLWPSPLLGPSTPLQKKSRKISRSKKILS